MNSIAETRAPELERTRAFIKNLQISAFVTDDVVKETLRCGDFLEQNGMGELVKDFEDMKTFFHLKLFTLLDVTYQELKGHHLERHEELLKMDFVKTSTDDLMEYASQHWHEFQDLFQKCGWAELPFHQETQTKRVFLWLLFNYVTTTPCTGERIPRQNWTLQSGMPLEFLENLSLLEFVKSAQPSLPAAVAAALTKDDSQKLAHQWHQRLFEICAKDRGQLNDSDGLLLTMMTSGKVQPEFMFVPTIVDWIQITCEHHGFPMGAWDCECIEESKKAYLAKQDNANNDQSKPIADQWHQKLTEMLAKDRGHLDDTDKLFLTIMTSGKVHPELMFDPSVVDLIQSTCEHHNVSAGAWDKKCIEQSKTEYLVENGIQAKLQKPADKPSSPDDKPSSKLTNTPAELQEQLNTNQPFVSLLKKPALTETPPQESPTAAVKPVSSAPKADASTEAVEAKKPSVTPEGSEVLDSNTTPENPALEDKSTSGSNLEQLFSGASEVSASEDNQSTSTSVKSPQEGPTSHDRVPRNSESLHTFEKESDATDVSAECDSTSSDDAAAQMPIAKENRDEKTIPTFEPSNMDESSEVIKPKCTTSESAVTEPSLPLPSVGEQQSSSTPALPVKSQQTQSRAKDESNHAETNKQVSTPPTVKKANPPRHLSPQPRLPSQQAPPQKRLCDIEERKDAKRPKLEEVTKLQEEEGDRSLADDGSLDNSELDICIELLVQKEDFWRHIEELQKAYGKSFEKLPQLTSSFWKYAKKMESAYSAKDETKWARYGAKMYRLKTAEVGAMTSEESERILACFQKLHEVYGKSFESLPQLSDSFWKYVKKLEKAYLQKNEVNWAAYNKKIVGQKHASKAMK